MDPKELRRLVDEALCSQDPGSALEALLQSGELTLLPEIADIVALGDANGLHKDVWSHTKAVVAGVPNVLELRWSALFHDIGKAKTRRFVRGRVTFHNHDYVGAKMVDKIQDRLELFKGDAALLKTVRSLVLNHLRPASYNKNWSDSSVRRLLTEIGGPEEFKRLMCLSRADLTTKIPAKRQRAILRGNELERRVVGIIALDSRLKLPKLTMGIILERSGKPPGAWLSELKDELERQLNAGQIKRDESPMYYANVGLTIVGSTG